MGRGGCYTPKFKNGKQDLHVLTNLENLFNFNYIFHYLDML